MPVYIGDYLADTMHLTTEQHGAYLLLLFHLWRRGTLPANDRVLAQITGLDAAAWSSARKVLAEFFEISDGCWHHGRVERERTRISLKQEANSKKAKTAAMERWRKQSSLLGEEGDSSGDASIAGSNAPLNLTGPARNAWSNADGDEDALPDESESDPQPETEQEPRPEFRLAEPRIFSSSPKPSRGKRPPDPRHVRFREILGEYWAHKNHSTPEMPWEGRDAKALSDFLAALPGLGEEQFRQLLRNRAKSAVAHGDRVYLWIANLTRYQEQIGIYNKPLSAGAGHATRAEIHRDNVVQAVGHALELARGVAGGVGQAGYEPPDFVDGGGAATDGAGSGRRSVAVLGDGDHRMAARHAADGAARADGSLPHRPAVESAGGGASPRGAVNRCAVLSFTQRGGSEA